MIDKQTFPLTDDIRDYNIIRQWRGRGRRYAEKSHESQKKIQEKKKKKKMHFYRRKRKIRTSFFSLSVLRFVFSSFEILSRKKKKNSRRTKSNKRNDTYITGLERT